MNRTVWGIHYSLLLDRSGATEGVRGMVLDGFNENVQTAKKRAAALPGHRQAVSPVTSNHLLRYQLSMSPPRNLRELTMQEYLPPKSTTRCRSLGPTSNRSAGV